MDDGSTDATPAIVAQLAAENAWVRHLDRSSSEGLGLANGRREGRDLDGFRAGLAALPRGTDVFVKVDADVDFDARLLRGAHRPLRRGPAAGHRQRHVLRVGARPLGAPLQERHHGVGRHARVPLRCASRT